MPRLPLIAALLAAASLALPAMAQSRLPGETLLAGLDEYRYFPNEDRPRGRKSFAREEAAPKAAQSSDVATRPRDGFEFIGGETGWQPSSHKLVWSGGRFVHSDECDHVIRTVQGPSTREIDRVRNASPGG